jgi:hypothetical protein
VQKEALVTVRSAVPNLLHVTEPSTFTALHARGIPERSVQVLNADASIPAQLLHFGAARPAHMSASGGSESSDNSKKPVREFSPRKVAQNAA